MSYHAVTTPETEAILRAQRRNSTIASIIIGILLIALLALIFWIVAIPIFMQKTEPIVSYQEDAVVEEEIEKVKVTPVTSQAPVPSASSSSVAVVVAQAAVSSFSVPTVDVMTESLDVEFGESEGFGDGWGGTGFGDGQAGGGAFTLFGRQGGEGLQGNFYDQKIDRRGRETEMGKRYKLKGANRASEHAAVVRAIIKEDFSEESLKPYFRAETELSFTHLVMENEKASVAPEAFNVADQVTPSGWIVVYEGEIDPSEEGDYKFVGRFDDLLLVFLNDELVFDGSWSSNRYTDNQTRTMEQLKGKSLIPMKFLRSDYVKISSKDNIRIVVGESPGGYLGGGLFVQKRGKGYKKENGQLILPPFTTAPLSQEEKDRLSKMKVPIELDDVPVFHPL